MDCKHARLLLEVAHPLAAELDPRDQQELADHLSDCPECGPVAEAECRLDEHIGKAMRAVPVPPDLSQRIMGRLNVTRRGWYRKWTVRAAAVAAALLLAVGAGWAYWGNQRPIFDPSPFDSKVRNADDLEQHFADKGISMKAPRKFDYAFLDSCGLAEIQGKTVPYMLFAREGANKRPALAYVYVLSDRTFDLTGLAGTHHRGSHKILEVFKDPVAPGVDYLAVYSAADNLQWFCLARN